LEPLRGTPQVRYCSECRAAVHLVEREAERSQLTRLGKCIAIMRDWPCRGHGRFHPAGGQSSGWSAYDRTPMLVRIPRGASMIGS